MAEQEPYTATDDAVSPQPPTAASATPATPAITAPDATHYTEMISPKDYRVYRVSDANLKAYKDYGYIPSQGNKVNEEQVASSYNSWQQAGQDFVVQTIGDAPFVRAAYSKVATADQSRALATHLDQYAKDNPWKNVAANVLGTGAEMAAAAAMLPAAVGTAIAGAGVAGAMGVGAVTNTALGAIARFDDASIHHAFEPAGQEKSAWAVALNGKDMLADAAIGAALPGLTGVAGKTLGWLGKNMQSQAQTALRNTLITERGAIAAAKQGRTGDLINKIDQVLDKAPTAAPGFVKANIQKYGLEIETIKSTVGKKVALSPEEREGLIVQLHAIAPESDQIHTRLGKFYADENFTLDHMQKLNNKIRESVGWSDYDVNRPLNDAYQHMMQAVRSGMDIILQDHDASFGGTTASQWSSAFSEYSDWQIVNSALNRKGMTGTSRSVLQGLATNALGGGALGGLYAAAKGEDVLAGAEKGAAFGAGMGLIKNIRPEHYALGAKKLGAMFEHLDNKLTQATMRGLYGIPAQLHSRQMDDSSRLNGALSAVQADPEKAFTNMRTAYSEAGIPDVQADDASRRHLAMLTDIAKLQPKRGVAPDLPTRSLGDPMQQRKLHGLYRVAQDPTYAMAHPTKENMAFLQKHYPNIAFNFQQAVIQQVQQNPDLPYHAKRYASRVLGRPVGNSTSPQFSQMISDARAKMAQAEQAGAQPGGPQRPKKVQSDGGTNVNTRLDGLQGGD